MADPGNQRVITQVKQYQFVRELGRGGMGAVFEATDLRDGSRVAVKLLHPWLVEEDSTFRDRFEREAHIAALLRSPYSVRVLDFGIADGVYFLVMEYVEGTTVAYELEHGNIDPARALRIAIDVARALEEATARGVVHRDIKPDNILVTSDDRVKVTDFGIARQEGGTGLTAAGRFVGTPEYSSPEQAVGNADHRSDIYALGATLYCMLAGHPPFQGATIWDTLREHERSPLPMGPLQGLPDVICNPIRRCMEKDPRDRYQSASDLAGALERALQAYQQTGARPARPAPSQPGTRVAPSGSPPPAPPAPSRQAPPVSPPSQEHTRMATPGTLPSEPRAAAPPPPVPAHSALMTTRPAAVSLMAVPAGDAGPGVTRYQLTITNLGSAPIDLALAANEPSRTLAVSLPASVALDGAEVRRVPFEVRQLRKAPANARTVQFQVAALRSDGSRAGFVNLNHLPTVVAPGVPGASGGGRRGLMLGLGGVAIVAVAGAIGAFALQGGGGKSPSATPTPSVAASASASVAAGATGSPSPTPGSIAVIDRWDLAYRISTNNCSFGLAAGNRFGVSYRIQPATGNATTIKDGDRVKITGLAGATEAELGTFTFRFPDFSFDYNETNDGTHKGTATVHMTFADAHVVKDTTYVEKYTSPACEIAGVAFK